MPKKVTRYELKQQGEADAVMAAHGYGDWVSADDYDDLCDELEVLRDLIKDAYSKLSQALNP